nr:MAG TPA: ASCH domain protein [Caudoviricetes sp.]
MTIKPILFNTEMVRAILDGRKSCTRRLLKEPFTVHPNGYITKPRGNENFCPYEPPYQPGDILYVRETVWQKIGYYLDVDGETKPSWYNEFRYVASDEKPETGWNYSWSKRPSIHMPKEAARIWLKVTDVRVERLQEITEKQACMEGTDPWDEVCYENNGWHPTFSDPDSGGDPNMIDGFHKLWNSTIKKSDIDRYGWDANPYVWVISFDRCEKPEGV